MNELSGRSMHSCSLRYLTKTSVQYRTFDVLMNVPTIWDPFELWRISWWTRRIFEGDLLVETFMQNFKTRLRDRVAYCRLFFLFTFSVFSRAFLVVRGKLIFPVKDDLFRSKQKKRTSSVQNVRIYIEKRKHKEMLIIRIWFQLLKLFA